MDIEALEAWVEEYGLAVSEVALIKRTYQQTPASGTLTVVMDTEYGLYGGFFTLITL